MTEGKELKGLWYRTSTSTDAPSNREFSGQRPDRAFLLKTVTDNTMNINAA